MLPTFDIAPPGRHFRLRKVDDADVAMDLEYAEEDGTFLALVCRFYHDGTMARVGISDDSFGFATDPDDGDRIRLREV